MLLQRIDCQAAQQLGKEVSGFLRHDSAGKGDFAKLFHGHRVGEEGHVGFAAANLVNRLARVAEVANVGLLADLLRVQAKQPVEDDGVQMAEVELALVLGQISEAAAAASGFERSSNAPVLVTATKAVPGCLRKRFDVGRRPRRRATSRR